MVKSIILMLTAEDLRKFGHRHPMGHGWRGIMDFDPVKLSRKKMLEFCAALDTRIIRDIFPVGTPRQVAARMKGFVEAGLRVIKFMDYGGMAGLKYGALSAMKVREAEDELLLMCKD